MLSSVTSGGHRDYVTSGHGSTSFTIAQVKSTSDKATTAWCESDSGGSGSQKVQERDVFFDIGLCAPVCPTGKAPTSAPQARKFLGPNGSFTATCY